MEPPADADCDWVLSRLLDMAAAPSGCVEDACALVALLRARQGQQLLQQCAAARDALAQHRQALGGLIRQRRLLQSLGLQRQRGERRAQLVRGIGHEAALALHGLPRERITEQDMTDPAKLRQYNIIFLGMRGISGEALGASVEQYIREGGIVVAETGLPLSSTAVPGRRIGPAPHPNIRFVDDGTALTRGLPQLGVVSCLGGQGIAVVPEAGSKKQ